MISRDITEKKEARDRQKFLHSILRHDVNSKLQVAKCYLQLLDEGKGDIDDQKRKIFERSYREGEYSGSGSGMFLVKEVLESYGGDIEVKDSEIGGIRFDIRFEKSELD